MSLKPPKKSDLGKSWMKNRRDKARMIQPEYHLIASEGTETEPQYFGAIQKIINAKYRDRIQLKVEGIGDNTVNLLMKARQYVQNNGIVFKHVWIVYDTDDFPAENIDMVAQLCEEYNAQGETIYHAVWSNQCVELWYLLHFMYQQRRRERCHRPGLLQHPADQEVLGGGFYPLLSDRAHRQDGQCGDSSVPGERHRRSEHRHYRVDRF